MSMKLKVLTPAEQAQLENNKALYMNYLYDLYDRDNAVDGIRGTFTGLAEQHAMTLGRRAISEQVKHWHYIGVREQTQTLDGIRSAQEA